MGQIDRVSEARPSRYDPGAASPTFDFFAVGAALGDGIDQFTQEVRTEVAAGGNDLDAWTQTARGAARVWSTTREVGAAGISRRADLFD